MTMWIGDEPSSCGVIVSWIGASVVVAPGSGLGNLDFSSVNFCLRGLLLSPEVASFP